VKATVPLPSVNVVRFKLPEILAVDEVSPAPTVIV
jgi:hypothetical protein